MVTRFVVIGESSSALLHLCICEKQTQIGGANHRYNEMRNKMQIGILGTGRMGVRLAAMFADCGHAVILGSRDLSRAERIVSGLCRTNITAGTYEQATDVPM